MTPDVDDTSPAALNMYWVTRILRASVYDIAIKSPLESAPKLSERLGSQIRFKREDAQPVFSFKLRGAYNCINALDDADKARGIICASAGNHAQGVALSAHHLKINATIVMPQTTPEIKVLAVKHFGGKFTSVVLYGDSFDEAKDHAIMLQKSQNLIYIPPYDNADVIAGQGTIGQEIYHQWRDVEYVFIPTGGGGLLAGVAAYLGQIAPTVKVVAVEPAEAACLQAALCAKKPVTLPQVGIFVDGTAVGQIGQLPFKVINQPKADGTKSLIEPEVVTCTNDEVCAAIKDVFEESRSIVEPAGALAVAGMKQYLSQHGIKNANAVAIISGANMNFDRLRYIAERTEIGEAREAVFAVTIPEKTGAFLDFCRALNNRNITEFNYRYNPAHGIDSAKAAPIYVGVKLNQGQHERQKIKDDLSGKGYQAIDLTEDEIAKNHIRHLIGGHSGLPDEQVFNVQFPERPQALLNFLEKLGQQYNITLFHYRNHGAAEGRVLVGIQVMHEQKNQLEQALNDIGYYCQNVTDNPGLQLFLG